MKKVVCSLIVIFNLATLIICRPHGLKNFGSTCYINSVLQAFNALDPVTAYLLTQNNPYKKIVGHPPAAGLAHYYVEFLKKMHTLSATPANVTRAADSLDYPSFIEFKNKIFESAQGQGIYKKFPFEQQDKDYVKELSQFYITTLAEFLYRAIYGSSDPLPPTEKEVKDLLAACPQSDAPQFMELLINALIEQDTRHEFHDTKQALQNHPLGKLFRIELKNTRDCPDYKGTATEQEARLNLQTISDDGKETFTTLQACINNVLSTHTVQFKPPGLAEFKSCTQQAQLRHLSDIVILTLNRFAWISGKGVKYAHKISVPLRYNFAPHVPTDYAEQTQYELVAALEHIGGYGSGHYIAYIKQDGQWYICNDEHVFVVDVSTLADYSNKWGAGSKEHRGLDYGYVYFYQKTPKTPEKKPSDEPQLRSALHVLTQRLTTLEKSLH